MIATICILGKARLWHSNKINSKSQFLNRANDNLLFVTQGHGLVDALKPQQMTFLTTMKRENKSQKRTRDFVCTYIHD